MTATFREAAALRQSMIAEVEDRMAILGGGLPVTAAIRAQAMRATETEAGVDRIAVRALAILRSASEAV